MCASQFTQEENAIYIISHFQGTCLSGACISKFKKCNDPLPLWKNMLVTLVSLTLLLECYQAFSSGKVTVEHFTMVGILLEFLLVSHHLSFPLFTWGFLTHLKQKWLRKVRMQQMLSLAFRRGLAPRGAV